MDAADRSLTGPDPAPGFLRKTIPAPLKRVVRKALRLVSDRVTRIDRELIARKYLRGHGLEIGALHAPLPVPRSARVRYVDRMSRRDLLRQYPELARRRVVETDIIDDGEHLSSIADSSQDFLIANHFLEHCENPLLTLRNMMRVLKPGGILYLTVPDKRFTFDRRREVTPREHLIRDYEEGPSWSRRQHFADWVRHVQGVEDPLQAERNVRELEETGFSIHYHVWTQREILDLLELLRERLGLKLDLELFLKHGQECILIVRKLPPASDERPVGNSSASAEGFHRE